MDAPKHSKAERDALKRITPPKKQPAIVGQTLAKVEKELKKQQLAAKVHLGGSLAKGTYLKGDHDVDVFVRFGADYDDAQLAEHLEKTLAAAFGAKNLERVHGSRDYFHVQRGSFTFEFVPVLEAATWAEARNVTDMSPLHVAYVADKVKERPWLAAEIRLTKLFCKAAKVYGAESYIGGFSGHVIDLLNIHYAGFQKLLEAASAWPAKVVIDPEAHHDNPMVALNDSKTLAPLVIVDPVQQDRNSAAAVTEAGFRRLRTAAKGYLAADDKERAKFFTIVPLKAADVRKAHPDARIIEVILVPLAGKRDVVGAKCFKVFEHCVQQLAAHQFPLLEYQWEFTQKKATLLFALRTGLLPADEELAGPPVHKTQGVAGFTAVHTVTFTRDGRVYAVERRKYRDAAKLLADVLQEKYATLRVKSAKLKTERIKA